MPSQLFDELWPLSLPLWETLDREALRLLFRALVLTAERADLPRCLDYSGAEALAAFALLESPLLARVAAVEHSPLVDALRRYEAALPDPTPPYAQRLTTVLQEPLREQNLHEQLAYVARAWRAWLGETFAQRLTLRRDILAEYRGAPAPDAPVHHGPPGPPELPSFALEGEQPEQFTEDESWMAECVLIAKHTLVWLHQLSIRYETPIHRLDQIPEEEFAELRQRGYNGLWLIGLWERSDGSRTIKRRRGNPEAAASAYALWDYTIAQSLGGEGALEIFREKAWRHGIRLGADMVPNHVGVDGRWLVEHPEWFIQSATPPYPNYRFTGPDLSLDPRCTVQLEDGYWNGTDAAVVFRRTDTRTGEQRYIFHGNDGTGLPWNDTAQLDHLNPDLREALIDTIVGVAKRFPILRFDAAMTLARRHIQRLWHPRPGEAGAIPSRAVLGVSPQAFDAAMPNEFWREVVDRCQVEAPDCLLLAEAFWMMESYFVRSLGMHRVYNSAFMHLLRDENGEEYQRILAEGLAFSPAVLERFVNFVSNPDEEPAAKQFGKSDKYFGIATLMATLPGLPMFGHGQMEGLEEKYGMEYARSYVDEAVDAGFLQWHRERVVPLLYERRRFSGVAWFSLFAARDGYGERAHHVYAYANRTTDGELPSLVVFNNQPNGTRVHLLDTVPFNTGPSDAPVLETRTLAEALGVPRAPDVVVAMWELWGQGWRLIRAEQLFDEGLWLDLRPYETQVVLDVRCIPDPTGALGQRADELAGAIVPSIEPPEQTEEPPSDDPAHEAPVDGEPDEEIPSDESTEVPTEPVAVPSEPAGDIAPV